MSVTFKDLRARPLFIPIPKLYVHVVTERKVKFYFATRAKNAHKSNSLALKLIVPAGEDKGLGGVDRDGTNVI